MSNEQHIHELIDQYLSGELIGQELDKFKIRLKDDASFLKQVQIQKAIIQSIEVSREAELRALLTKSSAPKKRGFVIPFQKRTLSIAAAILVFIAVGVLIKSQFPNGFNNLAENKPSKTEKQKPEFKPKEQEKPVISSQDSFTHDLNPPDDKDAEPLVNVVEDNIEKPEKLEPENDAILESPTLDLSELQEDEDVINADEVDVPKRDSMIGQKSISLYVFAQNVNETATTKAVEGPENTTDKKRLFERKKNKDATDKEEADDQFDTDYSDEDMNKYVKSVNGSVKVEFWVSVVNFKGYKFDGQKLLLFDTKPNTLITVSKLNGQSYVSKNGVYYKIIPNNSFNQLSKVTDAEVIKALSTR